jgi:hypothetical protein
MPTDLMILAVEAAEIAGGKEDRPRPVGSGEGRFFAVVGHGVADDYFHGETAEALFSGHPVHAALPRAQDAGGHHAFQGVQCLEIPLMVYSH